MLSRFTRPDRSNYTPNLRKSATNDQLDLGWNEGILSDGRAYRVEAWAQDGVTSVTVFMPTCGIENISNDQLVQLFEREGLITWESGVGKSVHAVPHTDGAGVSLWSVSVVLGDEERVYARDALELRPYGRTEPQPTLARDDVEEGESPPSENDELSEFSEYPDNLLAWGYTAEEENTTSPVRWVWYTRVLESSRSQVRLRIAIEFELSVSDEPTLSVHQSRSYSFNGVRLEVYDRRMERWNSIEFDEETETPRLVGHAYLALTTLREVEDLIRLLRFAPPSL